jgi:hypothetical protein
MSYNDRLKEFIDTNKIHYPDLYKKIGASRMEFYCWLNTGKAISLGKIIAILQLYPQLNARWFLTGEGDMQEGFNGRLPPSSEMQEKKCEGCVSRQIQIDMLSDNVNTLKDYLSVLKEQVAYLKKMLAEAVK